MNGRGHTGMTEASQNMPYSDRLKDHNVLSLTKGRLRDGLMTIQMYSDRVQGCRKGQPFNLTDRVIKRAGDWKLTLLNSIWEGCALCLGEITAEQPPNRWFHHHWPFQTHAMFFSFGFFFKP